MIECLNVVSVKSAKIRNFKYEKNVKLNLLSYGTRNNIHSHNLKSKYDVDWRRFRFS